jgi:hypothetical protein
MRGRVLNRDIMQIVDRYVVRSYRKLVNKEFYSICEDWRYPFNVLRPMTMRAGDDCILCNGNNELYRLFCEECWDNIEDFIDDEDMLCNYGDLFIIEVTLHARRQEYLKQLF